MKICGESIPIHGAKLRERRLRGALVPCLYVGDDFEEDLIGQVICVSWHMQGVMGGDAKSISKVGISRGGSVVAER